MEETLANEAMIPRFIRCKDCKIKVELTEEEVALLLPFLKQGWLDEPVEKTIGGYCDTCSPNHPGKAIATCPTMEIGWDFK